MTGTESQRLAILPLPPGLVLLPGTTTRIPVQNRPDVRALFSTASTRSRTPRFKIEGFLIGCVPLKSHLLSDEGQKLIADDIHDAQSEPHEDAEVYPAEAREEIYSLMEHLRKSEKHMEDRRKRRSWRLRVLEDSSLSGLRKKALLRG